MKKDYLLTFAAEFLIILSGLLVYKLAALHFGKAGFAEYALFRRTVSFFQPVLLLGLGVGLIRFISAGRARREDTGHYLSGGLLSVLTFALVMLIPMFFAPGYFAFLFFGNTGYSYLIRPLTVMLLGVLLDVICYTWFRGHLSFAEANVFHFVNLGCVPAAVFWLADDLQSLFYLNGLFWIIFSAGTLIWITWRIPSSRLKIDKSKLKSLLSYSVRRVPGDLAMTGLFSLPSYFAAHAGNLEQAGAISFGIALVNMVGASLTPISAIILPRASEWFAAGKKEKARKNMRFIFFLGISLALLSTLALIFLGDFLFGIYLGEGFTEVAGMCKILIFSSAGYLTYIGMRSFIDAYYLRARNSTNLLLALALFLALTLLSLALKMEIVAIAWIFVMAITLLGVLSFRDALKISRP